MKKEREKEEGKLIYSKFQLHPLCVVAVVVVAHLNNKAL